MPASEYRAVIRKHRLCAILLIAAETNQLKMAESLLGVKGDYEVYAIPVSNEDAHLAEVARVPKIRLFEDGVLKHDHLLNKDDISSLETLLRKLGLY